MQNLTVHKSITSPPKVPARKRRKLQLRNHTVDCDTKHSLGRRSSYKIHCGHTPTTLALIALSPPCWHSKTQHVRQQENQRWRAGGCLGSPRKTTVNTSVHSTLVHQFKRNTSTTKDVCAGNRNRRKQICSISNFVFGSVLWAPPRQTCSMGRFASQVHTTITM